MQFLVSFHKTAQLTFHNDGSEFKVNDDTPAPYEAGGAQMSPSGIQTNQPDGKNKWQPVEKQTPGQKKMKDALLIATQKEASGGEMEGSLDYVGTKSDAADTLATQLKWDQTSNDTRDNLGYNKNSKKDMLAYLAKHKREAKK